MSSGPASYGIGRALSAAPATATIVVDPSVRRSPSDQVGVGVSRGLANMLPARADWLFRRRVYMSGLATSMAETRQEASLTTGKCTIVADWLGATSPGTRLCVTDPRNERAPFAVVGGGARGLALRGGRQITASTAELLLVVVGDADAIDRALTAGLNALRDLCGGRTVTRIRRPLTARPQRIEVSLRSRSRPERRVGPAHRAAQRIDRDGRSVGEAGPRP